VIQRFVDAWERCKKPLRLFFQEKPGSYDDVVVAVLSAMRLAVPEGERIHFPDPACTTVIEGVGYQGVSVYVLRTSEGDDPEWYVRVGYGTCSHCDTLDSIEYGDTPESREASIDQCMTLALHIVQNIREFEGMA